MFVCVGGKGGDEWVASFSFLLLTFKAQKKKTCERCEETEREGQ
jgi:hypothetical protein